MKELFLSLFSGLGTTFIVSVFNGFAGKRNNKSEDGISPGKGPGLGEGIVFMSFLVFMAFVFLVSVFGFLGVYESNEKALLMMKKAGNFSDNLLVVTIEERMSHGWRKKIAELISKMSEHGAESIVLDLVFNGETQYDVELADAIRLAENRGTKVFSGFKNYEMQSQIIKNTLDFSRSGHICYNVDNLRYHPLLVIQADGPSYPALALLAAESFKGEPIIHHDMSSESLTFKHSNTKESYEYVWYFLPKARIHPNDCPISTENSRLFSVYIDLTAKDKLKEIPFIPYSTIREYWMDEIYCSNFKGKIVLVGALDDTDRIEDRYGVHLHADLIRSLLDGSVFFPADGWSRFFVSFFLGIFSFYFATKKYLIKLRLIFLAAVLGFFVFLAVDWFFMQVHYKLVCANFFYIVFWVVLCFVKLVMNISKKIEGERGTA